MLQIEVEFAIQLACECFFKRDMWGEGWKGFMRVLNT